KIILDVPAVLTKLLKRRTWNSLLRDLQPYSERIVKGNRIFHDFDKIRDPFNGSKEKESFRKRFIEVSEQLDRLQGLPEYRMLEDAFRAEVSAKVWNPDEQ